jgi:hypothetical protein
VINRKSGKGKPAPGVGTLFEKAKIDLEQDPVTPGAVTATHITGTTGVPWVPAQPPNSPWAGADPAGDEPPLGYSVEDVPDMEKVDR